MYQSTSFQRFLRSFLSVKNADQDGMYLFVRKQLLSEATLSSQSLVLAGD